MVLSQVNGTNVQPSSERGFLMHLKMSRKRFGFFQKLTLCGGVSARAILLWMIVRLCYFLHSFIYSTRKSSARTVLVKGKSVWFCFFFPQVHLQGPEFVGSKHTEDFFVHVLFIFFLMSYFDLFFSTQNLPTYPPNFPSHKSTKNGNSDKQKTSMTKNWKQLKKNSTKT